MKSLYFFLDNSGLNQNDNYHEIRHFSAWNPPHPHLSAKLADLQQLSCQEDGLPKLDTSKMRAFYDADS